MARPILVLVTGASGAGKTRLAHALAEAIGCPAICRDEIKEGMLVTFDGAFTAAQGDELTQRTFPVFFDALRVLVSAGVSLVAEAAFQDRIWRMGLEPLLPLADIRIIRCVVADDVAQRRRLERGHRPAHADADPWVVAPSAFQHVTIAVPSLVVDTTNGYEPPLAEVVRFARAD